MVISILTLFPEVLHPILNASITGRAQKKEKVVIRLIDIRKFSADKHKTVDDKPFGGGVGMLLKINVLYKALQSTRTGKNEKIILLDPTGNIFSQKKARELTSIDHLILICGHYEGVDARINYFIDEKISIGKYILTGGEIPSLVITDAITRLIPGVLKNTQAVLEESYSLKKTIEPPQYTRPADFMGYKVPGVLLSGDPKKIEKWKKGVVKVKDSLFR